MFRTYPRPFKKFSSTKSSLVADSAFVGRIDKILQENLNGSSKIFLTSLRTFAVANNGLTQNQLNAFEKIESRFSPESKILMQNWENSFDDEKKTKMKIASHYYKNTPYFTKLATLFLDDPSFLPSADEYQKMVENKYAQRVIDETLKEPKFKKNELVEVFGIKMNDFSLYDGLAFVLQTDSEWVSSACKGAKKYKILPFGKQNSVIVEERFLRKSKKGKASPK